MSAAIVRPVRFDAASYALQVTMNGVAETLTAAITASVDYWPVGDGRAQTLEGVGDLLKVLQDTLDTHTQAGTSVPSVALVLSTGAPFVRVTVSTSTIALLWDDLATTLDGSPFGFAASTGLGPQLDGNQLATIWLPGIPVGPDSRNRPRVVRGRSISMSGIQYTSDFGDATRSRRLTFNLLNQAKILEEYASNAANAFESHWVAGISKGQAFRLYEDQSTLGSGGFGTYVQQDLAEPMERSAADTSGVRWDVTLDMIAQGLAA
ncbi:MAG: hypothetical protein AAGJ19_13770 [Myxococcota bacterium]